MKLRDLAKGTLAVNPVTLRLANSYQAAQPGQPPSSEPVQVELGVRVLTGAETLNVYEKARVRARQKGVETWKDDDPICSGALMAETVAVSYLDRADNTPFFRDADELLESELIGTDNIAYLHEQFVAWQDRCSIRSSQKLTTEQAIAIVLDDMEAPGNPESPLLKLGHTSLVSLARTLAVLLSRSLKDRSPSGSAGTSSTSNGSTTSESADPQPTSS